MLKQVKQMAGNPLVRPVLTSSRKAWLAYLGAFALMRRQVQSKAPRVFKELVDDGRELESRLIRATGQVVEAGVGLAKAGFSVAQSGVSGAASQALGMAGIAPARRSGRGVDLGALSARVEELETRVRTLARKR